MDCLIGCGTWIAGKIAECTVAQVGSHLGYIYHYRRNVRALETETKEVNDKKKILEDLADEAKRRGENIRDHIQECLTKVVETTQDAQNLINTNIECSLRGCFSSLVERYRLSKRAEEMTEHVVEIKGKIRFDNISFRPKPKNIFENKDYLNSATRDKFVDGIRKVLEDSNIRTIGIHGMPGAGKTTLVKEIARKATSDDWNLFDDAIIITVSETPNIIKIQQEIADRLGLKFCGVMEFERALELRNRMKDEKRFLIILDDIWNDKLKLEDAGIVFESDQKGCKILMTSRFERVLGNDMGVDKNFKVDILSEDEARNWFWSIVGDQIATSPAFQKFGNKIVEKCGRLPLCIVTAAHSLKNCDKLPLWKIAWRRLKRSKHDEVVHTAIKLCYDKLRSDEAKQLLMLCSLHEEDANIKMENLMRYCKGQINMFEDAQSLQEARDVVYCLVEELKDCCLLLDGDDSDTVKMHDVVRDVAISIAKESRGMHCFGDGSEVEKFLEKRRFEDLEALSLPNGYLDELVFERSKYTQLHLMICMWKKSSLKIIPRDFFERTEGLRGLVFSRNELESPKVFASHLSPLENLRSLCLRGSDVEDIAEIGKLKKLEILDLSGSNIKKLPSEIGQLTRLRMLDLNGCRGLQVIEPNVIPHLNRLEELYVDEFENWHRVDQADDNGKRSNAGLDELNHLDHLTALHLFVGDVNMLPKDLLSQQLKQYKIKIKFMGRSRLPRIEGVSRQLQIKHIEPLGWLKEPLSKHLPIEHVSTQLQIRQTESSLLREHGLEMLMKRSEELLLEGLNGVNDIVNELDTEGFPELRSLELTSNNTIQHLVNSMGEIHLCTVFGRLEALFLEDLSNLQQICHGEVTVESFKMLRAVTVRKCNRLKKLLPLFNARQIEEIRISDCNAMEEIFTHEIQDDVHDDDDNKEELLQLRTLELVNLSKLRELCSEILLKKIGSSKKQKEPFVEDSIMPPLFNGKFLCFPKLENMELRGCHVKKIWDDQFLPSSTSFCCLKKLVVANCKFLECVVSSSMVANFKQLSHLEVKSCEAMEIIVSRDERTEKMSFPELIFLSLEDLPRLSKFSSGIFSEFPMLCDLDIRNCPELKTFISESSEEKSNTTMPSLFNENFLCFRKLKNLKLQKCNFKRIWDDDQLVTSSTFCCLSSLEVVNCPFLKYVFSSAMALCFEQLQSIEVRDCGTMEEIMSKSNECMDNISFPQLQSLTISHNANMVFFSKISEGLSLFDERFICFPKLEKLELTGCHVKKIWDDEFLASSTSFCCLKKLVVYDCKFLKCVVSSSTAASFKQLKNLVVTGCEAMEIIVRRDERMDKMSFPKLSLLCLWNLPRLSKFSSGIFSEFPMLHHLDIWNCPELKTFISESFDEKANTTMPSLFNENFICFPKLEDLKLRGCHVKKIWDDEFLASSTSFCCLKELVVYDCKFLKCVVSSSTAASFKQLEYLEVTECEAMELIVRRDERMDKMSFPKLSLLRLWNLPRLSKFSSGIFSEFPMLRDLDIWNCPELKTFISESFEEKANTTMPSLFNENLICFPKLENLRLVGCHVKKIWDDEFLASSTSFCCLKKLDVNDCKFLKCVVSSSMAASFKQLEYLMVARCEAMELIVRRDERMDKMSFPKLRLLCLWDLPRLSKFSSGIFIEFPMLPKLYIQNCPELKTFISESFEEKANTTMPSLFNENVAFPSLKTVCVEGVDGLKMIWQYGRLSNNAESFCQLEDVVVEKCKNLMGIFSSGMHTRLGNLQRLKISECEMVEEIFEMETSNCGIEEVAGKREGLETVVFLDDEFVFPQLREMQLKSLPNLVSFYAGRHTLSFPLLEELEVIECLKVKAFSGSELLSYQGRHESLFSTIFSTKVTFGRDCKCKIKLRKLPNLMHLMEEEEEESSQQQPQTLAFPYMIDLEVVECGRLENLVPSSISFQNLNSLMLTDCDEMLHLLSSQTAKSMTQLRRLEIRSCKRMEEIISDAGVDHSKGGEIVFTWLDQLVLDDLPTLANFYSGNYTIRFPNLEFLSVDRCFEMQNFSKHSILSTQKLEEISINGTSYGGPELESKLKSESETESSSNWMVGINSIIAKHCTSHHRRTALQELSTEKDITPLNPSEE